MTYRPGEADLGDLVLRFALFWIGLAVLFGICIATVVFFSAILRPMVC
jgi:hypothetical protein